MSYTMRTPGRLIMKVLPRVPAVCLDRIAVGIYFNEIWRMRSPNPGNMRSHTLMVASGVTSLFAGPVPPVVMTMLHFTRSLKSQMVLSMRF